MTKSYAIRVARPDDLAALPIIERAAAAVFRTTPYAYLADDDLVSAEVDLAQRYGRARRRPAYRWNTASVCSLICEPAQSCLPARTLVQ
jgi:hypothetical protein